MSDQAEFKQIEKFPKFEINKEGVIRYRINKRKIRVNDDGRCNLYDEEHKPVEVNAHELVNVLFGVDLSKPVNKSEPMNETKPKPNKKESKKVVEKPAKAKENGKAKTVPPPTPSPRGRKPAPVDMGKLTTKHKKVIGLECKKHIKIYKLMNSGLTNKETATALGTNTGHVYNVMKDYGQNPEKVKAADAIKV